MTNAKRFFRHELANAITTLSILISESGLGLGQKKIMEKWIRKMALMLSYEPLFLGRSQSLLKTPVDVFEVLAILDAVHGNRWGAAKVGKSPSKWMVKANREALFDALRLMAEEISAKDCPSELKADPLGGKLWFKNVDFRKGDLKKIDLLMGVRKESGINGWAFQLALSLFALNGIKVTVLGNRLMISLSPVQ
jgi:hypothetical protein